MNKTHLLTFVFIFFNSLCALAIDSVEAPPSNWKKGGWGFSAQAEYFQSRANYDEVRGSYSKLATNNSFNSLESTSRIRYSLSRTFSFYAGLGVSQARAIDSVSEKTNSGLSQALIGGDFLLWNRWIRLVPEVQLGATLAPIKKNQTQPLYGDGVNYLSIGLHALKPFSYFRLTGYAGAYIPADGFAKLFRYSLGADWRFTKRFAVIAEISGYETLLKDELTLAERSTTTTSANAGSMRFATYNPALLESRIWLGFKPDDDFELRAGYGKTIDGVRSAEGQSILFSLSFNQFPYANKRRSSGGSKRQNQSAPRSESSSKFKAQPESTETLLPQAPTEFPNTDGDDSLDDAEQILEDRNISE